MIKEKGGGGERFRKCPGRWLLLLSSGSPDDGRQRRRRQTYALGGVGAGGVGDGEWRRESPAPLALS